jgi:hypothetical protein
MDDFSELSDALFASINFIKAELESKAKIISSSSDVVRLTIFKRGSN